MMPGSPAPTMGPGTAVNTAMQPNGQKVLAPAAFEPASGTKLEDELRVVGLDERACGRGLATLAVPAGLDPTSSS
jgi:hypothetical protein